MPITNRPGFEHLQDRELVTQLNFAWDAIVKLSSELEILRGQVPDTSGLSSSIAALERNVSRLDKRRSKLYFPSAFTTDAGTLVGGVVGDLNDRGAPVQWGEVAAAPGFDITVGWVGLPEPGSLLFITAWYDGGANHEPQVQLWNYDTAAWEMVHQFNDGLGYLSRTIPLEPKYWRGGGTKVRFYHPTTGNAAHDLYVDYLAIRV